MKEAIGGLCIQQMSKTRAGTTRQLQIVMQTARDVVGVGDNA